MTDYKVSLQGLLLQFLSFKIVTGPKKQLAKIHGSSALLHSTHIHSKHFTNSHIILFTYFQFHENVVVYESVPTIIINNTINLFIKTAINIMVIFQTITVSECRLIGYILFEKRNIFIF